MVAPTSSQAVASITPSSLTHESSLASQKTLLTFRRMCCPLLPAFYCYSVIMVAKHCLFFSAFVSRPASLIFSFTACCNDLWNNLNTDSKRKCSWFNCVSFFSCNLMPFPQTTEGVLLEVCKETVDCCVGFREALKPQEVAEWVSEWFTFVSLETPFI